MSLPLVASRWRLTRINGQMVWRCTAHKNQVFASWMAPALSVVLSPPSLLYEWPKQSERRPLGPQVSISVARLDSCNLRHASIEISPPQPCPGTLGQAAVAGAYGVELTLFELFQ